MPEWLSFSSAMHQVSYVRLPADPAEAEATIKLFQPIFEDENKTLISPDVKNDIIWLKRAGISIKNAIFDVKIAHYVLHPDFRTSYRV